MWVTKKNNQKNIFKGINPKHTTAISEVKLLKPTT